MNNIVIEVSPMFYDGWNAPRLANITEDAAYYNIEVVENDSIGLSEYSELDFQSYLHILEQLIEVYPDAIICDGGRPDVIMMGIDK